MDAPTNNKAVTGYTGLTLFIFRLALKDIKKRNDYSGGAKVFLESEYGRCLLGDLLDAMGYYDVDADKMAKRIIERASFLGTWGKRKGRR